MKEAEEMKQAWQHKQAFPASSGDERAVALKLQCAVIL